MNDHKTPQQVKRLTQWSKARHKLLDRVWRGVASPRIAIKTFCLECVGEKEDFITNCPSTACPLMAVQAVSAQA